MTTDEVTMVAKIMLTADGWCSSCQHGLFEQLLRAFPEHEPAIKAVLDQREDLERRYNEAQSAFWDEGGREPDVLKL